MQEVSGNGRTGRGRRQRSASRGQRNTHDSRITMTANRGDTAPRHDLEKMTTRSAMGKRGALEHVGVCLGQQRGD